MPTDPINKDPIEQQPNQEVLPQNVVAQNPTTESIVGDAAQSANSLLSVPEVSQQLSEQPVAPTASSTEVQPIAVDASTPQPAVMFAADQPLPGLQPAQIMGMTPGASAPTRSKKPAILLIVFLVLVLLLVGGGVIFYFTYWTKSEVVYKRFQQKIAKVVEATGTSQVDLVNDYSYKVDVGSEDTDGLSAATSSGRGVESGLDTNSDITYKKTKINAELRLLNEDSGSPYQLYFKLKGIGPMFDAIYSEGTEQALAPRDKLVKYDDKWIFVDLAGLLNSSSDDTSADKPKALTKAQYKELWQKFIPVVNDRLVGLGESGDVYVISNERSDKVAGKSTWAFDVVYDKKANNNMMDELKKLVDTTSLADNQKKLVKDTLESSKDYIEEKSANSFTSKYTQDEKVTIWLDKFSGLPLKLVSTTTSAYDGKQETRSSTTAMITSITVAAIKGTVKYETSSDYSQTEGNVAFEISNKSKTFTSTGNYQDTNKKGDKKTSKTTFSVKVEPNTDKKPVEKPTDSTDYKQAIKDITGQDF